MKSAEFCSYETLSHNVSMWEKSKYMQLYKHHSSTIEAAAKRASKMSFNEALKYAEINYACIHGGKKVRHFVRN